MSSQAKQPRVPSDDGIRSVAPSSADALHIQRSEHGSDPTALATPDARAETERTLSEGRLCAFCGTSIGRRRPQARFCSDACRTHWGRQENDRRVARLLATMIRTVHDLRRELALPGGDHGTSDNEEQGGHRDG